MSTATESLELPRRLPTPPPRRHRPQLLRGLRAMRALLAEPDSTGYAFEVDRALDGFVFDHELVRMLRFPEGRKLYYERPCLLDALSDEAALEAMPEESFGRAYLGHIRRFGLDPKKLIDLRCETDPDHAGREPGLRWFVERLDLSHDLFHVLTGYGADGAGEAALLPFTLAQRYRHASALLTLGAGARMCRVYGLRWIPYAYKAYRRGRRATHLTALPYEALLPQPLSAVRRAVGIEAPESAHRVGLLEMLPTGQVVTRSAA